MENSGENTGRINLDSFVWESSGATRRVAASSERISRERCMPVEEPVNLDRSQRVTKRSPQRQVAEDAWAKITNPHPS